MSYKSILIALTAIILLSMVPGRGHLKFDESFKDLGEVNQGEIKSYSFSYTNTGVKKLKIASVIAMSNCLEIAPIKDSIVEPDGNGEITILFDTNKKALGEFSFGITVKSNADNNEVKLKLFGLLK